MAKQPQNRKSYTYSGPVTPLEIEGEQVRMLYPGTSYTDLPEENPIVSNLIARGLLIAETADTDPAPVEVTE